MLLHFGGEPRAFNFSHLRHFDSFGRRASHLGLMPTSPPVGITDGLMITSSGPLLRLTFLWLRVMLPNTLDLVRCFLVRAHLDAGFPHFGLMPPSSFRRILTRD